MFVPPVGSLVGIAGNVKRPAVYELKEKCDLSRIFELAGGIIPSAYTQQIQVERIKRNEREIAIDINDKNLIKSKDFMLQDGDLVKVFAIVEKIENVVTLSGNVKRPGKYEYKPKSNPKKDKGFKEFDFTKGFDGEFKDFEEGETKTKSRRRQGYTPRRGRRNTQ